MAEGWSTELPLAWPTEAAVSLNSAVITLATQANSRPIMAAEAFLLEQKPATLQGCLRALQHFLTCDDDLPLGTPRETCLTFGLLAPFNTHLVLESCFDQILRLKHCLRAVRRGAQVQIHAEISRRVIYRGFELLQHFADCQLALLLQSASVSALFGMLEQFEFELTALTRFLKHCESLVATSHFPAFLRYAGDTARHPSLAAVIELLRYEFAMMLVELSVQTAFARKPFDFFICALGISLERKGDGLFPVEVPKALQSIVGNISEIHTNADVLSSTALFEQLWTARGLLIPPRALPTMEQLEEVAAETERLLNVQSASLNGIISQQLVEWKKAQLCSLLLRCRKRFEAETRLARTRDDFMACKIASALRKVTFRQALDWQRELNKLFRKEEVPVGFFNATQNEAFCQATTFENEKSSDPTEEEVSYETNVAQLHSNLNSVLSQLESNTLLRFEASSSVEGPFPLFKVLPFSVRKNVAEILHELLEKVIAHQLLCTEKAVGFVFFTELRLLSVVDDFHAVFFGGNAEFCFKAAKKVFAKDGGMKTARAQSLTALAQSFFRSNVATKRGVELRQKPYCRSWLLSNSERFFEAQSRWDSALDFFFNPRVLDQSCLVLQFVLAVTKALRLSEKLWLSFRRTEFACKNLALSVAHRLRFSLEELGQFVFLYVIAPAFASMRAKLSSCGTRAVMFECYRAYLDEVTTRLFLTSDAEDRQRSFYSLFALGVEFYALGRAAALPDCPDLFGELSAFSARAGSVCLEVAAVVEEARGAFL